ncbi:hypothetical protein [Sutterella wadsworthensis]|uniref:hypothetical protein n=1 Tax=Sutterella wadsworthensis TaxID=40545 RepID=UPI003521F281
MPSNFFHPAKDQNKQHLELIKQIENSEDIIETLCTLDPNRTIPPYEDQNNRRPPLDQTLLLSPEKLTRAVWRNLENVVSPFKRATSRHLLRQQKSWNAQRIDNRVWL